MNNIYVLVYSSQIVRIRTNFKGDVGFVLSSTVLLVNNFALFSNSDKLLFFLNERDKLLLSDRLQKSGDDLCTDNKTSFVK